MAKHVLTNAFVEVDAVDLSNHFSTIEVNTERDEVDVTGFGSTQREILLGLGDGTISGEVFQDFATGSVDETLWPLSQGDTPFVVRVRADAGVVSATNPEYTMTAVLPTFNPLSGSVGEANSTSVTFRNSDQAGIVRATV